MTQQTELTQQRANHDRHSKAWTNLVIGALVFWIVGLTGLAAEATAWNVVGYAGVLTGIGMVAYGVHLFQKPRP